MTKRKVTKKKVTKKSKIKRSTRKVAPQIRKKVTKKVTKKVAKKKTKKVPSAKVKNVVLNALKIGELAPDFSLRDQFGQLKTLSDYRGKYVVVYFYPRAMTPGCTVQACSLRDAQAELANLNIVVLGISPDPVNKLKQFVEKDKLNFTLLSDENHKVADAYGSWGPKSFMGRNFDGILRQSYLIDKEGRIVKVILKVDTKTHHDDVISFFKSL